MTIIMLSGTDNLYHIINSGEEFVKTLKEEIKKFSGRINNSFEILCSMVSGNDFGDVCSFILENDKYVDGNDVPFAELCLKYGLTTDRLIEEFMQ